MRQIAIGDEFRVLTRDEQDVAKTFAGQMPRFLDYGLHIERHAQDALSRENPQ